MKREQQHHIEHLTYEINWWIEAFHSKSGSGFVGLETVKAKQSISKWPFIHIWKMNLTKSSFW